MARTFWFSATVILEIRNTFQSARQVRNPQNQLEKVQVLEIKQLGWKSIKQNYLCLCFHHKLSQSCRQNFSLLVKIHTPSVFWGQPSGHCTVWSTICDLQSSFSTYQGGLFSPKHTLPVYLTPPSFDRYPFTSAEERLGMTWALPCLQPHDL